MATRANGGGRYRLLRVTISPLLSRMLCVAKNGKGR